jgi:hypothetical protein
MTRREIHAVLQRAFDAIAELHGRLDEVSSDTGFAIGKALGTIGQAKALVSRDIEDRLGPLQKADHAY